MDNFRNNIIVLMKEEKSRYAEKPRNALPKIGRGVENGFSLHVSYTDLHTKQFEGKEICNHQPTKWK